MDDLQEVKQDVKEILQRTAVHNELLRTHEARSLALQQGQSLLDARIKPIEVHVHFVSFALKSLGIVFTGSLVGLIVQATVRHFFK